MVFIFYVFFSCISSFSYDRTRTALEDAEGLLAGAGVLGGLVSDDVEPNGLGEGTALSDSDDVTLLDLEGGRAVSGKVLVTLLETTVLGDVVEVVPADDDSVLHLGGHDDALEDAATDGDVAGGGGLDTKADGADEAHGLLAAVADRALASDEDGILALVSLLVLVALDVLLSETRHDGSFFC